MRNFRKLKVWQKSYEPCLLTYKMTQGLPRNEEYSLKQQLRRSSVSVPSNIAEGYMRQYVPEYVQFLSIALGSAGEYQTQLMLARDLGYVNDEDFRQAEGMSEEIVAMLTKLIKVLKQKGSKG